MFGRCSSCSDRRPDNSVVTKIKMLDVKGKNVVYVGGFSGIGQQVCRMLVQKNVGHLIICSRIENVEMLKKLQAENAAVNVSFVHVNVLDRSSIEQAVQHIVTIVKNIDVLVNGVGVLADKDVETTIGVDLIGVINTTLACLPYMDQTQHGRGNGVVVNIASVYGLEPSGAFPVYAAAKFGVVGFTRSMADEHHQRRTGISFVCVCPGLTSTELMVNARANVHVELRTETLVDVLQKAKQQTPEECAVNVVKVIEAAKNGGIYICNLGQLKEVTPTVHWRV